MKWRWRSSPQHKSQHDLMEGQNKQKLCKMIEIFNSGLNPWPWVFTRHVAGVVVTLAATFVNWKFQDVDDNVLSNVLRHVRPLQWPSEAVHQVPVVDIAHCKH